MCNKMFENTYNNTIYLFLITKTYVLIIINNQVNPY